MTDLQADPELAAGNAAELRTDLPGRWYVAHTRSRNEKRLATELQRLRIMHYLPLARRVTRSPATRRISRSWVPVFPGYVFLNATEEQRYATLRTNRVAHLLDVPDQAQLIAELTNVQRLLCTAGGFHVLHQLKAGDWGRVIAGPLAGVEGVIARVSHRLRLSMNVTILGQSISIEVDADNVEQIDPPLGCRRLAGQ